MKQHRNSPGTVHRNSETVSYRRGETVSPSRASILTRSPRNIAPLDAALTLRGSLSPKNITTAEQHVIALLRSAKPIAQPHRHMGSRSAGVTAKGGRNTCHPLDRAAKKIRCDCPDVIEAHIRRRHLHRNMCKQIECTRTTANDRDVGERVGREDDIANSLAKQAQIGSSWRSTYPPEGIYARVSNHVFHTVEAVGARPCARRGEGRLPDLPMAWRRPAPKNCDRNQALASRPHDFLSRCSASHFFVSAENLEQVN